MPRLAEVRFYKGNKTWSFYKLDKNGDTETAETMSGPEPGHDFLGETSLPHKILFFLPVIALAFLPGWILVSVFLLALYYLAPCFWPRTSTRSDLKPDAIPRDKTT